MIIDSIFWLNSTLLFLMSFVFLLWPLLIGANVNIKHGRRLFLCLPILFTLIGLGLYQNWGNYSDWRIYRQGFTEQQLIQKLNFANATQRLHIFIGTMKQAQQDNPNNATIPLMLARAYNHQQDYPQALTILDEMTKTFGPSLNSLLEQAQTHLMMNQGKITPSFKQALAQLVERAPSHPVILSLRALEALQEQRIKDAVQFWQQALPLLPADSEDANAIKTAIKAAKESL